MNENPVKQLLIACSSCLVVTLFLLTGTGCVSDRQITQAGHTGVVKKALPDIKILDTGVYPESVTSANDGTVFVGSVKGNVYRAEPGSATASAWIKASPANGILSIFGVLADGRCRPSAVLAATLVGFPF